MSVHAPAGGIGIYADTYSRYGEPSRIVDVCQEVGATMFLIRGPSSAGVGPHKLKRATPPRGEIKRAQALHDAGIQVIVWDWPVPDPRGPESDLIILPARKRWADELGAQGVADDMEIEWQGLQEEACEYVLASRAQAHDNGRFLIVSTYRFWQHKVGWRTRGGRAVKWTQDPRMQHGFRYTNSIWRASSLADVANWQTYDSHLTLTAPADTKRCYDEATMGRHDPAPFWTGVRAYQSRYERKKGIRQTVGRFEKHVLSQPSAGGSLLWSYRQLAGSGPLHRGIRRVLSHWHPDGRCV